VEESNPKTKEQGTIVPAENVPTTIEGGERRRSRSELLAELRALDVRAHQGDEEAPQRIRRALEETPDSVQILSNIAIKGAERAYLEKLCGGDPLLGGALTLRLEAMREEVAGPGSSPLERLLAERAVACWLQVLQAEAACAANLGRPATSRSEYHERRLDRAHRRYLAAIRTLAQVRKLLRPTLTQINVAQQQVNMATGRQEGSS